jgi:5-methylcytosine-specific restriction endonuclease McrA
LGPKVCKGCGVEKDPSEFYAATRNLDRRMGKCKACVRARVRENRRMRQEQYAQYERSRANLPHRVKARKKYQQEHKEQISEYTQRWAASNSERVAGSKRAHSERNREEVISRSKTWADGNAEKVKIAKANNRRKRRAAKNAGESHFTVEEFDALCSVYGYACLCCGATDRILEADHVVPLTKGGSDDISNFQPLCGECNRRKFTAVIDYRQNVVVQSG